MSEIKKAGPKPTAEHMAKLQAGHKQYWESKHGAQLAEVQAAPHEASQVES
jgi:hypothetical protein